VDTDHDPELFWALRGGGGGFGVVTSVEVDLFPVASVITGAAYWPAAHADRLLPRWLHWAERAPREATTSLRLMRLPALPGVPPALRAGPVICVDGTILASTALGVAEARQRAEDLLGPFRAEAEPILDSWHEDDTRAVVHSHLDPVDPAPVFGDHLLLGAIDDGGAGLLRVAGPDSGSPLVNVELRQLGGALAAAPAGGGALSRLDGHFAYLGAGVPGHPASREAILRHCGVVRETLRPWATGRLAPTFAADLTRPQACLDPAGVRAVGRVRARVDPEGLFRGDVAPYVTGG
jgi:hypothetical protein